PAIVAAVVLLAARWTGLAAGPSSERVAGAVALGVGFAVGFVAARVTEEGVRWAPVDPWDWLPYLALLAAAAGVIDPGPPARLLKWPVRLAVAAGAAWVLVPELQDMEPSRPVSLVAAGAAVFLLWSLLDPPAKHQPGALVPGLLALTAGAAASVLAGSANLK